MPLRQRKREFGEPAIERNVVAINWSKTVGTEGLRDRTPINRKLAGITYTNDLDLGIKDGSIKAASGLLKTQDIEDVIRGLVAGSRYTEDFDDLPIPFRAVATDMLAGEMVVLQSGDLSVAIPEQGHGPTQVERGDGCREQSLLKRPLDPTGAGRLGMA